MVCNAADKLATHKAKEAQSSLDNISPVNQLLPPNPSFSIEQYYSDSDSEQQTVQQSPNSTQQKIARADKMSQVTNALTQGTQIKPQLNGADD